MIRLQVTIQEEPKSSKANGGGHSRGVTVGMALGEPTSVGSFKLPKDMKAGSTVYIQVKRLDLTLDEYLQRIGPDGHLPRDIDEETI